jgi:hypothetical protein
LLRSYGSAFRANVRANSIPGGYGPHAFGVGCRATAQSSCRFVQTYVTVVKEVIESL